MLAEKGLNLFIVWRVVDELLIARAFRSSRGNTSEKYSKIF